MSKHLPIFDFGLLTNSNGTLTKGVNNKTKRTKHTQTHTPGNPKEQRGVKLASRKPSHCSANTKTNVPPSKCKPSSNSPSGVQALPLAQRTPEQHSLTRVEKLVRQSQLCAARQQRECRINLGGNEMIAVDTNFSLKGLPAPGLKYFRSTSC